MLWHMFVMALFFDELVFWIKILPLKSLEKAFCQVTWSGQVELICFMFQNIVQNVFSRR